MRILHVVPSMDPVDGGPTIATQLLAKAVAQSAERVTILTTGGLRSSDVRSQMSGNPSSIECVYTHRNSELYKTSFELVRWLNANIRNFDLVHIHALFSFSSTAAAFIAHRAGVAYIIRPLGVLNQWGLKNRRALLKQLSLALIEKGILTRASAIHYTTGAERTEAAKIGPWVAQLPSFVSPLPVPIEKLEDSGPKSDVFFESYPQARDKRIVLFLSRIDRKKGIELLLDAFAAVRKQIADAVLVIAGSGDKNYEASLRAKADQLGIIQSIIWTGFVDGELKSAILSAADIFVLPSYSENFGIAAAEAMAAGKACVLSDQVGLAEDAVLSGAVVITKCDAKELAKAIDDLVKNPDKRLAVGKAAADFAETNLSLEAVGQQLETQYRAILVNR